MRYLVKHFDVISLDDFVYHPKNKKLPRHVVIITFDDGFKDNYTQAYPILRKYGVPATFFLTTNSIGTNRWIWVEEIIYMIRNTNQSEITVKFSNPIKYSLRTQKERTSVILSLIPKLIRIKQSDREKIIASLRKDLKVSVPERFSQNFMLSWREIKEMQNGGMSFGAHTLTHPSLTTIDEKLANIEVSKSKTDIEKKLGCSIIAFSYPFGTKRDFNESTRDMLINSGYLCACTSVNGTNTLEGDLYSLKRIGIYAQDGVKALILKMALACVHDFFAFIKNKVLMRGVA
jgi:peptidoglycan/xylan/chitin deacetylase (PgdA/CDA1 family)